MIPQELGPSWIGNLNFYFVYLVILLGRSVLVSYLVLVLIVLLRRTGFRKTVFAKGMLWCLLFPVLFVGKLRLFYEHPFLARVFFGGITSALRNLGSAGSIWRGSSAQAAILFTGDCGWAFYCMVQRKHISEIQECIFLANRLHHLRLGFSFPKS